MLARQALSRKLLAYTLEDHEAEKEETRHSASFLHCQSDPRPWDGAAHIPGSSSVDPFRSIFNDIPKDMPH